jgi:hypothetical protein
MSKPKCPRNLVCAWEVRRASQPGQEHVAALQTSPGVILTWSHFPKKIPALCFLIGAVQGIGYSYLLMDNLSTNWFPMQCTNGQAVMPLQSSAKHPLIFYMNIHDLLYSIQHDPLSGLFDK